jgi:hypothetical protein
MTEEVAGDWSVVEQVFSTVHQTLLIRYRWAHHWHRSHFHDSWNVPSNYCHHHSIRALVDVWTTTETKSKRRHWGRGGSKAVVRDESHVEPFPT